MKILIDNKIPFIKGRLEPFVETRYLSPSEFSRETVKDADALVIRTRTLCNADLLAGSNVKLIATATIGSDHIDGQWCRENGIRVVNAAGCNAPGVTQYVWVNLLNQGFQPGKHTLGIIGFGNIGYIVADYARRLGVKNILINDPPKEDEGRKDISLTPLNKLLSEADAVTIHTPLTTAGRWPTRNLISSEQFALMKPGTVLINAARGEIVDEKALIASVNEKNLIVITDVWASEPHINRQLLLKSAVSTPHIAGYSRQGKSRATRMVLETLDDFLGISTDKSGLEPQWKSSGKTLSPEIILGSHDFRSESDELKKYPELFENMRETYRLREEIVED